MITNIPIAFRSRRVGKAAKAPVVVGPVLVDASFTGDDLVLDFDRDVSADAIVLGSFVVNDPASGSMYHGTGAAVFAGVIVSVTMTAVGPSTGTETVLNVSAGNGIVAVDDGAMWAGAMDLVLPFP